MAKTATTEIDVKALDKVFSEYEGKPGELLGVMEEAQKLNKRNYLPQAMLEYISDKTGIPLAQVYSVATFYTFFNLMPQGEHSVVVCRGTACHTRGSKVLLETLRVLLGFGEDELKENEKVFLTTKDNKFTIRTVACFGQCALAPVVDIDGKIYSHMTTEKLKKLIKEVSREKKRHAHKNNR